jgi:hypothetical protein
LGDGTEAYAVVIWRDNYWNPCPPFLSKVRLRRMNLFKVGIFVGGSGGNGVLLSPDGKILGYYRGAPQWLDNREQFLSLPFPLSGCL